MHKLNVLHKYVGITEGKLFNRRLFKVTPLYAKLPMAVSKQKGNGNRSRRM
jgi:hypothetical protein